MNVDNPPIYTVGHSNHEIDVFLGLLKQHDITALADVRSSPYSRMNTQFNRENLKRSLTEAGIDYVFMGEELGARTQDESCYKGGKMNFDLRAKTEQFQSGVERLASGRATRRIAMMCAEKEPLSCHRTILVARALDEKGIPVQHILEDGSLEPHREALVRLREMFKLPEADLIHTPEEMIDEAYFRQAEKIAYRGEEEEEVPTHIL
ncbi:MAG: DUF488 domain-containing protein [Candidatus Omnitrophica bacterium]|nr:DUF488 domain-containing protein [Candidatus Omnitrophota bacterium]MCA9426099.1 DUF488 domain-containing protein [Candidatus Omnitrophota bacterium]MCA9432997.1 DUF488 domain-containing protein [Candidatus Omnitrophota bacterium]MCA9441237.1 DUF488 domain-containing protein [Candidatus Omnitrophota bacterium]